MSVLAVTVIALVVAGLAAGTLSFALLITGRLTVDTGLGRRVRPLGPQTVVIDAPRERVFDLIAVPYRSDRPPRALRDKIDVMERGEGMVLAAHHTPSSRFTTTTVETVTFEPPGRVVFRLVRGPVPHVREQFRLAELEGGRSTELRYDGELGSDGWWPGAAWGRLISARWEATVADSLAELRKAAEAQTYRRQS
jgi:hypothetical protein